MGTARRWTARLGRGLIAAFFLVVVVRGTVEIVTAPAKSQTRAPVTSQVDRWPTDDARAFAVAFARAYFDYDPKHPTRYSNTVAAYYAEGLSFRGVPTWRSRAPRQEVVNAVVEQARTIDKDRALVTVQVATRSQGRTVNRYLAVPIAHGKQSGLVVYDLPSMTSGPLRAVAAPEETSSLALNEGTPINDLLRRFFTAYLAGDAEAVAAGPAFPGAQLGASPVRMELADVVSVELLGKSQGKSRVVLATVSAKDDSVEYTLTYRMLLVQGDRWYVAQVNNRTN